jgi:Pantoate-beta-alanine ligase
VCLPGNAKENAKQTTMAKNITPAKSKPRAIRTLGTLPPLKRAVEDFRRRRQVIALVPTMGALHAGHLALV